MENQQTLIHKCGLCNKGFPTEETYTEHVCDKTGFSPTSPDHYGEEFKAISEGALLRGELKKALVDAGYSQEQADLIGGNVVSSEQAESIIRVFITNKQSNA